MCHIKLQIFVCASNNVASPSSSSSFTLKAAFVEKLERAIQTIEIYRDFSDTTFLKWWSKNECDWKRAFNFRCLFQKRKNCLSETIMAMLQF